MEGGRGVGKGRWTQGGRRKGEGENEKGPGAGGGEGRGEGIKERGKRGRGGGERRGGERGSLGYLYGIIFSWSSKKYTKATNSTDYNPASNYQKNETSDCSNDKDPKSSHEEDIKVNNDSKYDGSDVVEDPPTTIQDMGENHSHLVHCLSCTDHESQLEYCVKEANEDKCRRLKWIDEFK